MLRYFGLFTEQQSSHFLFLSSILNILILYFFTGFIGAFWDSTACGAAALDVEL
jgi:hypothetical protein